MMHDLVELEEKLINFVLSKLVVGFFIDLMKNIISDSSSTIIKGNNWSLMSLSL